MIRFTKRLVLLVLALVAFSSAAIAQNYLYSYRTNGVWADYASWTTVSGGLQYQNTDRLIPSAAANVSQGDYITISSGKKMTYESDAMAVVQKLTVDGTLILKGKIQVLELVGKGEIILESLDQLRVRTQGGDRLKKFEGKVTFVKDYTIDASGSLADGYSFGALKVKSGTITLRGQYSIPGSVEVAGGSLVLDNAAGNMLTVGGDLHVSSGAMFTALGPNENIVKVYGDVVNDGTIGGVYVSRAEAEAQVSIDKNSIVVTPSMPVPVPPALPAVVAAPTEVKTKPAEVSPATANNTPVVAYSNGSGLSLNSTTSYLKIESGSWSDLGGAEKLVISGKKTSSNSGTINIRVGDSGRFYNTSVSGNKGTDFASIEVSLSGLTTAQLEQVRAGNIKIAGNRVSVTSITIVGYKSKAAMDAYAAYQTSLKEYNDYIAAKEAYEQYQADLAAYYTSDAYLEYLSKKAQYDEEYSRLQDEEYDRQYAAAIQAVYDAAFSTAMTDKTNRLITLQFEGNKDTEFSNNSNAKLYRIRAMKDGVRSVTVSNDGVLKAVAPTYKYENNNMSGIADYKNLPWSVSSGTLVLGQGVVIDEWGVPAENVLYGCTLSNYLSTSKGYSMFIPMGATLVIAGADVNIGKYSPSGSTHYAGAVVVAGKIQVKTGKLTLPQYSPGILFVTSNVYGGTAKEGANPSLVVDGGVINTSRIGVYNHQAASLIINDGVVNYNIEAKSCGNYNNRSLSLSKGSTFAMAGGEMNFTKQLSFGETHEAVNGIWLADASDGTNYRPITFAVTGGSVNIDGSSMSDFRMFGNGMTFYDVNVTGGAKVSFNKLNAGEYNVSFMDNKVRIHGLTVGDNSKVDIKRSRFLLSGSIDIGSNVTFDVPDGAIPSNQTEEDRKILVITSDNTTTPATYSARSDVKWTSVSMEKSNSSMEIVSGSRLKMTGTLTGVYGNLIGDVDFCGSANQDIIDENQTTLSGVVLHVNNAANNNARITLATDVHLSNVAFDTACRFNLGNKNLKLENYPQSSSWGENNMFYTDNSEGAGGITVPVPSTISDANRVHIGAYANNLYFYSWTQCKYTTSAAGKYFTVAPVYGMHPRLDPASKFYFYWKIKSDITSVSSGVYTCYVVNKNKKVYDGDIITRQPVVLTPDGDGHQIGNKQVLAIKVFGIGSAYDNYTFDFVADNCDSGQGCSQSGQYYTNGDYVITESGLFGIITDQKGKVYKATKSGEWSAQIWQLDGAGAYVSGNSISAKDDAYIVDGVTVTKSADANIKAASLSIDKGATFIANQNRFSQMAITKVRGGGNGFGKLQLNIIDEWSYSHYFNSDYTIFCASSEAEFIFNLSTNISQFKDWAPKQMPNLTIKSADGNAHSFRWIPDNNSTTTINGNLTLGAKITAAIYSYNAGKLDLKGKLTVSTGAEFDVQSSGNKATYYLRDNIVNQGTINAPSAANVFLYKNITNKGTIDLSKCKVSIEGEDATVVSGTATYGKTNLGEAHLNKSAGTVGMTTSLPLGDANGICTLYIEKGKFSHEYDNTSGKQIVYKGNDNYDIPAGSTFQVVKGNVRIYVPNATGLDCNRVRLAGSLIVKAATTFEAGSLSDGLNPAQYGGIGYISGSVITAASKANVSLAFLCPFNGDGSVDLESSANWTFSNSGWTSQNFGVFDIREGSKVNIANGNIYIRSVCTNHSVDATVFYQPTQSTFSKKAQLRIDCLSDVACRINATSPLGYLRMEETNAASVRVVDNPLVVEHIYIIKGCTGTFYCDDLDLTVRGNLTVNVNDAFKVGNNTVYFENEDVDIQEISTAVGYEITFNNLVSRANLLQSRQAANDIHVNGELRIERGEYNTKSTVFSKGNVYVADVAKITGDGGLYMHGDAEQDLRNEGEISVLVVDNERGINAGGQQSTPITITQELQLKKGLFRIGGNILDIKENATISGGPFDATKMIMTNASYTDRGVRLFFNAGQARTVEVPIGQGSKYSPVIMSDLKSACSGAVTIYCNNGEHASVRAYADENGKSKFLKYYWSITTTDGMSFTDGTLSMKDNINDAVGYESYDKDVDGEYMTAILSGATYTKGSGSVGDDASNIILTFTAQNVLSGIYTAGCQFHLPETVRAYITTCGGNWNGAIWQAYDVTTKSVIASTPFEVPTKDGCGFVIQGNVDLSNVTDNFLNIYFLQIDEGFTINFHKTQNNNVGTVTGKGKMVVETSNVPGGNFEDFFGKQGGIMEYAGTEDYDVFVGIPYHNNVIFSGSGQRILPTGANVACYGDLTLMDNIQLVMSDGDVNIGGDMIFDSGFTGKCEGDGRYVFNGTSAQKIESNGDFKLSGIGVKNSKGLTIKDNLTVNKLLLSSGVITMADDKVLSLPDKNSVLVSESDYSYVDGWLARYCGSNEVPFRVGDGSRSGKTNILASVAGVWKVRYNNKRLSTAQEEQIKTDVKNVETIGQEYWEVLGPNTTAAAKTVLRWDAQSGGFYAKTTKVLTYNGSKWVDVKYSKASTNSEKGTLLTAEQVSMVSGKPRIYVMTTNGAVTEFIWEGKMSSAWDEESNWNQQEVPMPTSIVIIGEKYDEDSFDPIVTDLSNTALAKSVKVTDGGNIVIKGDGTTMVISDDLTIEGTGKMTIEYTVDENPNFVLKGTQTGDIDIYREFETGRIYYVGSAVDNRVIKKPTVAVDGWGYSNLYLKRFDVDAQDFIKAASPKFDGTGDLMTSLNSFAIVNVASSRLKMHQVGKVSRAVETAEPVEIKAGAIWLSNPYSFALPLTKANPSIVCTSGTIDLSLYARINDGSWRYQTYNMTTGVATTGFTELAPFQGFQLYCNSSVAKIKTVPNYVAGRSSVQKSAMVGQSSADDETQGKILRLFAGNMPYADELVLVLNGDGDYTSVLGDSRKKDNEAPEILSQISTNKGGEALVISNFPSANVLAKEKVNLPLSVSKATKADELVIWIGNLPEFDFVGSVYLVDNLTGEQVNLSEVEKYSCPQVDKLYEGRFELSFVRDATIDENGGGISTAIEEVEDAGSQIKIFSESDGKAKITIFGEVENNAQVVAYDVLGRVLASKMINGHVTKLDIPSSGIVVVKVVNGGVTESQKLLM